MGLSDVSDSFVAAYEEIGMDGMTQALFGVALLEAAKKGANPFTASLLCSLAGAAMSTLPPSEAIRTSGGSEDEVQKRVDLNEALLDFYDHAQSTFDSFEDRLLKASEEAISNGHEDQDVWSPIADELMAHVREVASRLAELIANSAELDGIVFTPEEKGLLSKLTKVTS